MPTEPRRHGTVYLVVAVLVVAANLRGTITSVGPVLGDIASDVGLNPIQLGLLGSVPLIAFALISPLVAGLAARIGTERAVLSALVLLIVATVVRSLPGGDGNLWIGTALIGAAIAVCNVLVPAIVKQDFPDSIPTMTGVYSAVLSGFAALASGLAIPIAQVGGWQWAVGVWALPVVAAVVVWLPRVIRAPAAPVRVGGSNPQPRPAAREAAPTTSATMWSSAVAWQVTIFVAMQTLVFFLLVNWLPTIEVAQGVSPAAAGWHLFLFQIVGIVAGLGVTWFMRGRADQRWIGAVCTLAMVVAMVGLLAIPPLVVLWVVLAGLSAGSTLVVAFTLIAQRARTAADAGRLSGMSQGVGYLIAAAGPTGAGILFDLTGSWTPTVMLVIVVSLVQIGAVVLAGRDRYTH